MQTIKLLAILQTIDLELDADRRQFSENRQAMQPSPELQAKAKQVKETEVRLARWRRERRERDEKATELSNKIASLEKQLYGGRIRDVREQVAMQQNVESLKRHLATLEEAALEALLEQEEAEKVLAEEKQTFVSMKQAWLDKKATLEKEQETLVEHARSLKAKREQVVDTMPAADVKRYETMRKKLGGLAVAKLNGRSCGGCGASLPTAVVQKVHEGQAVKCPICGRLLYD